MLRVCIAAGGTGGHILPGLAVGRELKSRGHRVHFILRSDAAAQAFLAGEGFASSSFYYAGFSRTLSPRLLAYPFLTLAAFLSARRILERETPDAVLGMGGYISVPVGLTAVWKRIPLAIHEQNARAGLANRLLARWARATATSFPETAGLPAGAAALCTGLPLRPDLVPRDGAEARRALGLDPAAMTLLVFGGSQGARALNRLAGEVLPSFCRSAGWQVIHFAGRAEAEAMEKAYAQAGVRAFVRPYFDDMAAAYSAADFVVGRSGAGTVMEIHRMGRRALLVPFPHATDAHQEANARFLEKTGAAAVVLEKDLSADMFRSLLSSLPPSAVLREEARRRQESLPA
ncbi:MAG: undecaprenyldiphospho-muramoylpentapeptide beta-N-acetylglucosaminyltransferase, partial [Elusimicrobiota bacterium]